MDKIIEKPASAASTLASSRMRKAIALGNHKAILDALKDGADPNEIDERQGTPLMQSSFEGHDTIIQALLDAGADPNICISNGLSPALTASANGKIDALKMLHEAGADLHHVLEDGLGALLCACRANSSQTVSYLIKHGADLAQLSKGTGLTPITICCQAGDADTLKILLDAGADPMTMFQPGERNRGLGGRESMPAPCLHVAAGHGHADCVRILVEHPATDPQWRDAFGLDAAEVAAEEGHRPCADIIKARQLSIKERSAMEHATLTAPPKSAVASRI